MGGENFLLILCVVVVVQGLIGFFIGNSYDLGGLGFVLGVFLGPIGWLIVFAVGVGKNQKERLELESYAAARQAAPTPTPASARADAKLRIRRDGTILGAWPADEVQSYLETGELVWTDEFFDRASNSWVQLAGHQDLE